MIIKDKTHPDTIGDAFKSVRHLKILFRWKFLAIANLSFLILVSVILGLVAFKTPSGLRVVERIVDLRMYPAVFYQYLTAQLHIAEDVSLDVKHIDMQKILFARAARLDPDTPRIDEYVPAKIRYNGTTIKVKIRLKGDRDIHFKDIDQMSFRVKVRGGDALWGMRTFSLQKPRARNYVHEWIFHRMMEEQGLAALRYKFINLKLNGKDLGTYAVEEHFGKELIENHNRREGPILRFADGFFDNYKTRPIHVYKQKDWQDTDNLPIVERATYLLTGFQRGDLTFDEVFDAEKMARFYAINDLLGTYHAGVTKSVRFYYNPISGKLEPVPYDGHFGTMYQPVLSPELGLSASIGLWIYRDYREWSRAIFGRQIQSNDSFYSEYISTLMIITQPGYLDGFFERNKEDLSNNLTLIYRDMPLADNISYFGPVPHYFSRRRLYQRQKALKDRMLDYHLDVHLVNQSKEQLTLDVGMLLGTLPIIITAISCGLDTYKPVEQVVITPSPEDEKGEPVQISFDRPSIQTTENETAVSTQETCSILHFRILGTDIALTADILPWRSFAQVSGTPDFLTSTRAASSIPPEAVEINNDGYWTLPAGQHSFASDLVIPPKTRLIVKAGAHLNFGNGAMLFSYSPVDFEGTEDLPISFFSADRTSNGIAVLGAPDKSNWKHVNFSHLTSPARNGWALPSAVTIYESKIQMDYVSFADSNSEDSLNIVRSDFALRNITFSNSFSDALDLDFATGVLEDSIFLSSGNDAIDMSGSTVTVRNVRIDTVGDKAISIGEGSSAEFAGVTITDAEIGVASKDNSILVLEGVSMSRVSLGFIAFQKKPEYGPGEIVANDIKIDQIEVPYLVEKGSRVEIDGVEIGTAGNNLRDLLYGIKYGKASG